VTITGTGGVGKSRIALRVAADRRRRYRDGVWLVDLTRIDDPAAVHREIAATVALGDVAPEAVVDVLRDQQLLVVLDNCEHLLDAVSEFVSRVVTTCTDVTVLATSREPLGVAGETVWRVPPLRPEDAIELLTARAQAVASRFAVTDDNRAAVREVCERLDAIPLALELAAARLGSLTVDQLATRLDQRFRLLSGGAKGSLERHRTLQATVDWSYGLLDDAERGVFRRLGVFSGGFDLAAVEAMCPDTDAIDLLDLVDRLVAKSLLVADERPHAMRYRLLETMRQFAIDRLVHADELVATRDLHLDWISRLLHEVEETLWLGGDEAAAMRTIDDEDANVRAAFEWALERGELSKAVSIIFGTFGWLTARGRARDGLEMSRRVLERAPAGADLAMANFLLMCCQSNLGGAEPAAVSAAAETARLLTTTRHAWLAPLVEAYVAAWSYPPGDQAAAAACIDRCVTLADELRGQPAGVQAWASQPVLWACLDAGRLADARRAADEGIAAAAAANLSVAESRMALNRARIALAAGDLDLAWHDAEHAITVSRRTGERFVTSIATQALADVAERRGDPGLARDLLFSVLDDVAESQPPAALQALKQRIAALA
jgi:predicted ATPase